MLCSTHVLCLVVVDGHAGVVGEVCLLEHGEHVVPANGEEGSAHAPNVVVFHATVGGQDLFLTQHLLQPFCLSKKLKIFINGLGILGFHGRQNSEMRMLSENYAQSAC